MSSKGKNTQKNESKNTTEEKKKTTKKTDKSNSSLVKSLTELFMSKLDLDDSDLKSVFESDDFKETILEFSKGQKDKNTKKKQEKSNSTIKKNKTSYIFFCQEERGKIMQQYPELKTRDILKKMGENWRSLSDKQKEKYTKLASQDKERYIKEKKESDE